MKKYIKPISKTVEIEANAILAGSTVGVDANSTITGSQRAKGNFWEDDED